MHFKCRLPIDGLGQCKAREAYGEGLHFLCGGKFARLVLQTPEDEMSTNRQKQIE